jgi:SPP1 family predicted phage head-tail adaptor
VTDAGDFNRRLVLEAPVDTDDGAGGVTVTYQTVTTLWAQVTPMSARGEVVADRAGTTVTHRITLRARDDVTTRHRLQDGSAVYRIAALRESADRRFLLIDAIERRD